MEQLTRRDEYSDSDWLTVYIDSRFDDPDFDFNKKTLKSIAVLRWEYRSGSTLFFVWTRSKSDNEYPGDFDLQRDFARSFIGAGRNIFLLKVN